ncbi:O-antigen ligase family protein [Erythrobacter litoralis]|uniref:O-antigen ligase family protein n=1 Tax=Erythrobacter litoralis TaxID=39960 RepID=UPI0018C8C828|nr:O-antigen ligase family protein [Erythrobacter litoralis]
MVTLIALVLFAPRPDWSGLRFILGMLLATVVLIVAQLVPLPPSIWMELPGRDLFAQAALAAGEPQPWRPISIAPDATVNALFAMVVPLAFLALLACLQPAQLRRFLTPVLVVIAGSSIIGLIQFSGVAYNHPFVNDIPGEVSGIFANRNHFALFLAVGCALVPTWVVQGEPKQYWRLFVAIGMLVLFSLMALATGSRAGIIATVLALPLGFAAVWGKIRNRAAQMPKWMSLGAAVGAIASFALAIGASILLGRAAAIERLIVADEIGGIRQEALPTILDMIRTYFPFGTGIGTFDPAYRIAEPARNLSYSYFNQAHNDVLQTSLDGGMFGLLLLLIGIAWAAWRGVLAWRKRGNPFARLGFSILFLVAVASLVDYPARTPIFMVLIILAAAWTSRAEAQ